MNTPSNAVPESFGAQTVAPATISTIRPLYWSVRRELWEHRSIYMAPLIVAGVIVFASSLSMLAGIWEKALRAGQSAHSMGQPYDLAALFIMGVEFIVALFYCVDALYGERRDRSILFWKSLPVSDLTTVLAKACIPLVVLPLVAFVITAATQLSMLLWNTFVLSVSGGSVAALWTHLPLFQMWVMLLYHLFAVHGLWYAPIYGFLLLVSAWAKRAPFLWAVIPLAAIGFVENILFHTNYFLHVLGMRIMGGPAGDFAPSASVVMPPMSQLTPGRFLTSPGLWIGLGLTAVFLAAAVRLRRQRGPI